MPRGWALHRIVLNLGEHGDREFLIEARDEYEGKPIGATPNCIGSSEWNAIKAAWVIANAKFGPGHGHYVSSKRL